MRPALSSEAGAAVNPGDAAALVERFDRAWRGGTPPRIEEFLAVVRADAAETPRCSARRRT